MTVRLMEILVNIDPAITFSNTVNGSVQLSGDYIFRGVQNTPTNNQWDVYRADPSGRKSGEKLATVGVTFTGDKSIEIG